MKFNELVLTVLDEIKTKADYLTIIKHLKDNYPKEYADLNEPKKIVATALGNFIRNGDSRIKRIKVGSTFDYYLTKYESDISFDNIEENILINETSNSTLSATKETLKKVKKANEETYSERALHKILSTFLRSSPDETYSKTIFHERSNQNDEHQKWVHPDMVGVKFQKLKQSAASGLLKSINKLELFKFSSYELKREIKSEYELKKCFFQAVSNSSWANYSYLVAYDVSDDRFKDELERLNHSFGIGIIILEANPFESKVLYPARYKDLDFKTIDKLCSLNPDFKKFIELAEVVISSESKHIVGSEEMLNKYCDDFFLTDSEAEEYCIENKIISKMD